MGGQTLNLPFDIIFSVAFCEHDFATIMDELYVPHTPDEVAVTSHRTFVKALDHPLRSRQNQFHKLGCSWSFAAKKCYDVQMSVPVFRVVAKCEI